AFREHPPKTLVEAAHCYGEVLNGIEKSWQEMVKQRADAKQPAPNALPDPAQEELRQGYHGPNPPPNLPFGGSNDLEWLPDRPAQAKLQQFRKAVEQWRATGPGAPPRAMVLEDLTRPRPGRVFLRGNPNNLGDTAPRHVPAVMSGAHEHPITEG